MNKFKTAAAVAILAMLAAAPAVVHAAEGTAISGGYVITEAGNYYIDSELSGDIAIKNNAEGNVTLDLNGHTFTSSAQEAIENYGTLTIKDSVGTGSVNGTGDDAIFNKGTLTVESGTFAGGNYNALYNSSGTTTINGGTFTSSSSTIYVEDGSTVYIKGGTYTSTNNYSAATDSGTLEISGGTFNSKIKATKITMGTYTVPVEMAGGEISGGSFSNTVTGSGTTTISDGTFSGAVSSVSTISGGIFNGTVKSPTTVNGGTFNGTIDSWTTASKKWTDCTSPDTVTVGENCSVASYTDGCAVVTIDDVRRIKYVDRGRIYLYKGSNCSSFSAIKTDSTNQYIFYVNANGTDTYLTTSTSFTYATIGTTVKIKAKTTGTAATEDYEYVFKGWYTNSAGTGTLVSENESFEYTPSSTSAVYLYAVYEKTETAAVAAKKELANTWLEANGGYSSTSFNITSEDDMTAFAHAVNYLNYTFSGKTVTLTKDLDFSNKKYYMIGNGEKTDSPNIRFAGTFDGGNHTISHITLSNDNSEIFLGLFGYTGWATIKDLTIKDSSFTAVKGSPWLGVFVGGTVATKFYNCRSIDNTIDKGNFSGGLVGHSTYDTINNAEVSGLTIASVSWKTGGMIGYIDETTINGATVSGLKAPNGAASLVGNVNYGTTNMIDVDVDASSLPLIYEIYSNNSIVKNITLTGTKTNVKAASIVKTMSGWTDFKIQGGTYNVDTILGSFGDSNKNYTTTLNVTGGTFNGLSTIYKTITNYATANITGNVSGLTSEILSQCTDAGGFVQNENGDWVLEKANVIASAPDTQAEKLRTNIDAYVDEEGFGNLRVITDVKLVKSVEIEKFGTWFIPTEQYDENKMFEGGKTVEQEVNTTMTFADAQFAADLMKVPAEYLGTSITAVSYVKPVGDLEIRTVLFATTINEAMQHHRDLETVNVD